MILLKRISFAGNGPGVSGSASALSTATMPPGAANPSILRTGSHDFAGQTKRKAALIAKLCGSVLVLAAQLYLGKQQLCCNIAILGLHAGFLGALDALIIIAAVFSATRPHVITAVHALPLGEQFLQQSY